MRKAKWDWMSWITIDEQMFAQYAEKELHEINERRRQLCSDLRELRQRGTARARRAAERKAKK